MLLDEDKKKSFNFTFLFLIIYLPFDTSFVSIERLLWDPFISNFLDLLFAMKEIMKDYERNEIKIWS